MMWEKSRRQFTKCIANTYYVACYRNIVLGQLVDEAVVIGPVEVKYEGGNNSAKVVASKDAGGNYRLSIIM